MRWLSNELYGEWSWDVEWILEEAATCAAQTSWARIGYRQATEARAIILHWLTGSGTGDGWASRSVVRAMARHRLGTAIYRHFASRSTWG